ncbi:single-stranded-DNA-specific exonuclease RecJ [Granulicella sp. dw_53]|uniref:single-stranded-DNA-specific exonuclease RecJ n=1 Tax=Granulicella sp. dw_53 TaxID=2719792 RepID=UPI001BD4351C|nr:single-stranded-DNA-specific exonuclease RecJ [Granulicella sp. dw_53]
MSTARSSQPDWTIPPLAPDAAQHLATQLDCPLPIAALLLSRGISDTAAAQTFFRPSLDQLHDPLLMLGITKAVARIQQAIRDSDPILIYGDYDVDGTTATVLLKTAIERIAPKENPAQVTYHVPHRIREGYGMQTGILAQAAAAGVRLVISVDTGIRAFAAAEEAKVLGLDLIVTDHHLPDDAIGIPEAIAVINPAQHDCPYPNKHLCGAAVAFKLAHAILLASAQTAPDPAIELERLNKKLLPSFLKLVAIATVADSVPLIGENRAIVSLGLRELRNPVQPGLRALMQIAEIPLNRPPTATEVGFRIAPRINAAGRMDIASDVVELFLTKDTARATTLAEKLNRLNDDRRATEAQALAAIETQLEAIRTLPGDLEGAFPAGCIVLDDPDWHRGVLGILASRVVDRTGRPALILTHEDGHAHGSGRSVQGFHLLDALTAVHAASEADATLVFTRFGGHAHAVGFSLPSGNLPLLRARMEAHATPLLTSPLLCPPLACDAEVLLGDISPSFFEWLTRCGPFGIGNPEPILVTCGLTLAAPVRVIKDKHICLTLRHEGSPNTVTALGWTRRTDWRRISEDLQLQPGSHIDIAYRLKEKSNPRFPGLDLELVDLRLSVSAVPQ